MMTGYESHLQRLQKIIIELICRRIVFKKINLFIYLTKYKHMAKEYLGEFEELILTMVAALQEDAYGAAISDEIESKLKREVNLSAVHVTLYRLEIKGHTNSKVGGATKERGGRRKRIYAITSAGLAILRAMKDARIDLW